MTYASIASYILQAPDIHLHLTPQVTLNLVFPLNDLAQGGYFRLRQIIDPRIRIYAGLL